MITQFSLMRRGAALSLLLGASILATGGAHAQSAQTEPQGTAQATQPTFGDVTQFAPAPVLAPEAQALRSALEIRLGADSTAISAYAARDYKPLWTDASGRATEKARVLTSILSRAGDHALPVARYKGAELSSRLNEGGPGLEADLTAAFLSYARDIHGGALTPRRVHREIYFKPNRPAEGRLIHEAGRATDMANYLESLAPQNPAYRQLQERYVAFRSVAGTDLWGPSIKAGGTLRAGSRNNRVAEARARLTAMGDLDPNIYDDQQAGVASDGTQIATAEITTDVPRLAYDRTYLDKPMVEAIRRFQARHGLSADGVIGPATRKMLNISPRTRADQLAANLERMRWMNYDLGDHHIMVNLTDFSMAVMKGGRPEFESKVVIGKLKHQTPEFSDEMEYMVINPSWNVPRSIATKELLPRIKRDPGYLARANMKLVGANASRVNWSNVTARNFPGRIVQNPGRGNALGTVKFMFPNDHAIYLHDTPSKGLFGRSVRAYSHGCVRVHKPHDFAAYLLKNQNGIANAKGVFKSILNKGRERHVKLKETLPVHIVYRTAWMDENGVEQFRNDIYGRDRLVAKALKDAGVSILQ